MSNYTENISTNIENDLRLLISKINPIAYKENRGTLEKEITFLVKRVFDRYQAQGEIFTSKTTIVFLDDSIKVGYYAETGIFQSIEGEVEERLMTKGELVEMIRKAVTKIVS